MDIFCILAKTLVFTQLASTKTAPVTQILFYEMTSITGCSTKTVDTARTAGVLQ